eukprot:CAMPEP_0117435106 /NCGR_PEP_ID=MMETSP0759-20121206/304_1 /TAXON_ID=63605 /ORGANISM="Percolomonas cosmopolitus, Strain WS" /LENGTH=691 /DNA_ID=CAMNT_0005226631 /DNA_START=168 /DNA_END=2239 /DNA_ORIENTATION=-
MLNPFLEGIQRLRVLKVSTSVLHLLAATPEILRSLETFSISHYRSDATEKECLSKLPISHLKKLIVPQMDWNLKEVLQLFPQLKCLECRSVDIPPGVTPHEMENLEDLTCKIIRCVEPLQKGFLRSLAVNVDSTLSLSVATILDNVVVPCAETLQEFSLYHWSNASLPSLSGEIVVKMAKLTSLKALTLHGWSKEEISNVLSDLSPLEKISVQANRFSLENGCITASSLLRHSDTLKCLRTGDLENFSDLDMLKRNFPKLELLECSLRPENTKYLDLNDYPFLRVCHISDASKRGQEYTVNSKSIQEVQLGSRAPIKKFTLKTAQLKSVSLNWASAKIREMELISDRLTVFDVSNHSSVTMDEIRFECPNLRVFHLSVKNKNFKKLSIKHSGTLNSFVVSSHVVSKLDDAVSTLKNITIAGFAGHCYPHAIKDFEVFSKLERLETFVFEYADLKELKPKSGVIQPLNHVKTLWINSVLHVPLDTVNCLFPNVVSLGLMQFSAKSCSNGHLMKVLTTGFENVQELKCYNVAPHLKSATIEALLKTRRIPQIFVSERSLKTTTLKLSNATVTRLTLEGIAWSKIDSLPKVTHLTLHVYKKQPTAKQSVILKELLNVNPDLEFLKLWYEFHNMGDVKIFVSALRSRFPKLRHVCLQSTLDIDDEEELELIRKYREEEFLLTMLHNKTQSYDGWR